MVLPWSAQQLITELDQVFARAGLQSDPQVQSDYAKYLVIRVSGLVEQVAIEVVLTHVNAQASPTVVAHTAWRMQTFQNPNVERVLQLVGSFDRRWRDDLDAAVSDSERQALGSVRTQRNRVAHGQSSTVSLSQVGQYYADVKRLLAKLAAPF